MLVQLCTGMLGGIRRAQAHGDRWGTRWMGGAGMCASVNVRLRFMCIATDVQRKQQGRVIQSIMSPWRVLQEVRFYL